MSFWSKYLRRSTRVVFQLHLIITLPFQAFLLVLIGCFYRTAQKPLKNRSKIAWKTVQKSPQEMSGFLSKIWAVFFLSAQTVQTAQTAQILLENRSNRQYLERFLSGISTRASSNCFSQIMSRIPQPGGQQIKCSITNIFSFFSTKIVCSKFSHPWARTMCSRPLSGSRSCTEVAL